MARQFTNSKCSLCGCMHRDTISFKGGYVCKHCLEFIRESYSQVGMR